MADPGTSSQTWSQRFRNKKYSCSGVIHSAKKENVEQPRRDTIYRVAKKISYWSIWSCKHYMLYPFQFTGEKGKSSLTKWTPVCLQKIIVGVYNCSGVYTLSKKWSQSGSMMETIWITVPLLFGGWSHFFLLLIMFSARNGAELQTMKQLQAARVELFWPHFSSQCSCFGVYTWHSPPDQQRCNN